MNTAYLRVLASDKQYSVLYSGNVFSYSKSQCQHVIYCTVNTNLDRTRYRRHKCLPENMYNPTTGDVKTNFNCVSGQCE